MSLGYADRLKQKRNLGGQLGAQEYHQSFDDIKAGVEELAKWVSESKRVFVFTGAGISTSCGIPDFRGPNGIWTLRKKKMPVPTDFTPFEYAKPSFTHMAISALVRCGKVPFVCSQNVDSLHLWSGVPRPQLAELHGNCFAERCTACGAEYARDFQMETVDFKPSGRLCCRPGCGGPLVDNILDWDTPLPQEELDEAVKQAEEADVALVLGTSLQIQPANEIPTLTRDEGGKLVIVNLQKTPKDRRAQLLLRSRVDLVMALLVQQLGLQVPPYIRTETLVVEHSCSSSDSNNDTGGEGRVLTVAVRSRHGRTCPLPMLESLVICVSGGGQGGAEEGGGSGQRDDGAAPAGSSGSQAGGGSWGPVSSGVLTAAPAGGYSHSFTGVPSWVGQVRCKLAVRLVKWADEDKRDIALQHVVDLSHAATFAPTLHQGTASNGLPPPADLQPTTSSSSGTHTHMHSFVSQEVRYDPARVVEAFLASPPPVVLPEPPKKRVKKEPTPAPAPTRTSARRCRASQRAQERYPSDSSADVSSEDEGA